MALRPSATAVRGKILNKGMDTDRIGGGVSEYLEQFADDIYNWILQLLYVYDDDFQFPPGVKPPKLNISVKEGSLLPKDSTTIANQAIELSAAGKMSTLDLYKRLEYPNPEEMAANAWLEINAPQLLFKNNEDVQQALGIQAEEAQAEKDAEVKADEEKASIEIEKEKAKQGIQAVANTAEEVAKGNADPLGEIPLPTG